MIVVETSAVLAILLAEPDAALYENAIATAEPVVPASCFLEASMGLRRKGFDMGAFNAYIATLAPTVLPFDERQAAIAIAADRRYGRATGHPARLNFGDCMAYAAAIALDAPLLFKGDDFALTDVRRAEL